MLQVDKKRDQRARELCFVGRKLGANMLHTLLKFLEKIDLRKGAGLRGGRGRLLDTEVADELLQRRVVLS